MGSNRSDLLLLLLLITQILSRGSQLGVLGSMVVFLVESSSSSSPPSSTVVGGGNSAVLSCSATVTTITATSPDRRWSCLRENCGGSWSGTIGWIDIVVEDEYRDDRDDDGDSVVGAGSSSSSSSVPQRQLIHREDSNSLNMRLSFLPRPPTRPTDETTVSGDERY